MTATSAPRPTTAAAEVPSGDDPEIEAPASPPANSHADAAVANGAVTPASPAGEVAARPRPAAQPPDARRVRSAGTPQQRTSGIPRASQPGTVPAPEHHHLPGWVRRAHAQARPVLADILGHLDGEPREHFQQRVDELTAGISAGKFSLAWQYPQLIEEGRALFEQHRAVIMERQKEQRAVDAARRRAGDQLREAAINLPAEAAARLNRQLRGAGDAASIAAVESEVAQLATTVRSSQDRRRDREIERTRAKIARSSKAAPPGDPSESWQDVLRRLAAEQEAE